MYATRDTSNATKCFDNVGCFLHIH
jgi:hypothetical protein